MRRAVHPCGVHNPLFLSRLLSQLIKINSSGWRNYRWSLFGLLQLGDFPLSPRRDRTSAGKAASGRVRLGKLFVLTLFDRQRAASLRRENYPHPFGGDRGPAIPNVVRRATRPLGRVQAAPELSRADTIAIVG